MQLSSGARLGEICGLRVGDVMLKGETPYLHIRPHERLGRTLKTPGSEREVPLVGTGLWAAKQAIQNARGGGWLFPRYAQDNDIRATHASNTVNKWISENSWNKEDITFLQALYEGPSPKCGVSR